MPINPLLAKVLLDTGLKYFVSRKRKPKPDEILSADDHEREIAPGRIVTSTVSTIVIAVTSYLVATGKISPELAELINQLLPIAIDAAANAE